MNSTTGARAAITARAHEMCSTPAHVRPLVTTQGQRLVISSRRLEPRQRDQLANVLRRHELKRSSQATGVLRHGRRRQDVLAVGQVRSTSPTCASPHAYLAPLSTDEVGQQWGSKVGATTLCLHECVLTKKKEHCVLHKEASLSW